MWQIRQYYTHMYKQDRYNQPWKMQYLSPFDIGILYINKYQYCVLITKLLHSGKKEYP